jgi:hypothetical protein
VAPARLELLELCFVSFIFLVSLLELVCQLADPVLKKLDVLVCVEHPHVHFLSNLLEPIGYNALEPRDNFLCCLVVLLAELG